MCQGQTDVRNIAKDVITMQVRGLHLWNDSTPDLVISWPSACCGKGTGSHLTTYAVGALQEPLPGPDAFVSSGRLVAEYPSRLKYKAASTPVPIHPPEVRSDLLQSILAAQDQGGNHL